MNIIRVYSVFNDGYLSQTLAENISLLWNNQTVDKYYIITDTITTQYMLEEHEVFHTYEDAENRLMEIINEEKEHGKQSKNN